MPERGALQGRSSMTLLSGGRRDKCTEMYEVVARLELAGVADLRKSWFLKRNRALSDAAR